MAGLIWGWWNKTERWRWRGLSNYNFRMIKDHFFYGKCMTPNRLLGCFSLIFSVVVFLSQATTFSVVLHVPSVYRSEPFQTSLAACRNLTAPSPKLAGSFPVATGICPPWPIIMEIKREEGEEKWGREREKEREWWNRERWRLQFRVWGQSIAASYFKPWSLLSVL